MKVTITYRLEEEDEPHHDHMRRAYEDLYTFDPLAEAVAYHISERRQPPEVRALRNVGQGEWTERTAAAAIAHLRAVAQIAYRHREYSTSPASATLRRKTARAFQVAKDFEEFVNANLITTP